MAPPHARDKQNEGVIGGVSSFGADLATLATLQAQLAACDVRDSTKQAIPSLVGLIAFATIGVASTVVGLAGLVLWLADVFQARPGIAMMVVAMAGLVIAGIARVFPDAVAVQELHVLPPLAGRARSQPRLDQDHARPQRALTTRVRRCQASLRLEDLPGRGDADLADLAAAGLPAADLVGVELALAVEILPGLFEIDAGDRLPGGGRERDSGTSSKETAFLADPGGQLAVVAAADPRTMAARPRRGRTGPEMRTSVPPGRTWSPRSLRRFNSHRR